MPSNGHTTLGALFENRREPGEAGLPLMSVTMNSGLVDRDSLDRETDSALTPEEHLRIRTGDIAYNMMRMWQGASGMAAHDGLVSPAYIVLAPTRDVDPLFASYWFKSARMIHLFWAYSHGITGDRLRLYYKDLSKIPVTIPPKSRQVLIGKTLSAWDRAIADVRKLIQAKRRLKQGLTQQLLTGKRRLSGFVGQPWPTVCLRDIGSFYKGKGIGKSDLVDVDGVPAILYGELYTTYEVAIRRVKSFVSPQTAARATKVRYGDILFPSSGETAEEIAKPAVFLGSTEAVAGGDVIGFTPSEGDPLFLSCALNAHEAFHYRSRVAQGQSVVHIYKDNLTMHPVPFPSLEEQERIANVLDTCAQEISLLVQQRNCLINQKRGLMQKLLKG